MMKLKKKSKYFILPKPNTDFSIMTKYIPPIPLLCIGITLLLSSCYEDKGNYDYKELNEISLISPVEGTRYVVDRYDTLCIEPEFDFSVHRLSDDDMSYKWEIYLDDWANTETQAITLGTEKTLKAQITRPASINDYALMLTVTEKSNGASYLFKYYVSVLPSVLSGLMVLQDDKGKCRLDYLASIYAEPSFTSNRHIPHVYAVNNNGNILEGSPRGVSFSLVTKSSYEPQVKNLYVWTDKQVARINPSDFSLEHADEDLFMISPEKIDITTIDRSSSYSHVTVMINDGQPHVLNQQATMSYGYQFSRALKANTSLTGEMRFAPYVYQPDLFSSQTGYTAILYDEIGKRFVKIAQGYDVEPVLFAFNEQEEENKTKYFDVNNIGMDMIWMGKNYGALAYAVFTDGNKRHLYRMRFNIPNTETDSNGDEVINPQVYRQAAAKYDLSEATEGDDAILFECGHYAANSLLYASSRNIYSYDFGSREGIRINDPFPEEEEITDFCIYHIEHYTPNLTNVSGTLLYVATWNGKEGKVYEYPINRTTLRMNNREDANGNLNAPYNIFGGFGKIVDMCVKPQGRGDTLE